MRSHESPDAGIAAHMRTGRQGELIAIDYLTRLGYAVRDHNVRIGRHDEIDIVAHDPTDDVIVFAEVKARRSTNGDYRPEINITREKRRSMSRAARAWVALHEYDGGFRLDVICVMGNAVTDHFQEIGGW